jgi:hypothetical protein
MYTTSLHESIFDTAEECKADCIILPIYEYTKEFHTFVNKTDKKVILIINDNVPEDFLNSVVQSLNKKNNILYVANRPVSDNYILYDELYDNDIFFRHTNISRNDKTAVLLHTNNDINNKLLPILYPHSNNIVCFNNQNFNHPTNIGQVSINELPVIFNEYKYVADLTGLFKLESMACGCSYIDSDTDHIIENISTKKVIQNVANLHDKTFKNFVLNNKKLLEFLGA